MVIYLASIGSNAMVNMYLTINAVYYNAAFDPALSQLSH